MVHASEQTLSWWTGISLRVGGWSWSLLNLLLWNSFLIFVFLYEDPCPTWVLLPLNKLRPVPVYPHATCSVPAQLFFGSVILTQIYIYMYKNHKASISICPMLSVTGWLVDWCSSIFIQWRKSDTYQGRVSDREISKPMINCGLNNVVLIFKSLLKALFKIELKF